jgi:Co/Zn/Cd efflux system component
MVDAFTYLFNWFAERQKVFYSKKLLEQQRRQQFSSTVSAVHALEYRKYTCQLELVPPLISVSTLLIVTGFVLKSSIEMLVLDAKRDESEQSDPNVNLMILFSCLNLLLDIVNVGCFAAAKHAFGYKTSPDEDEIAQTNDTGNIIGYKDEVVECEIEMTEQKSTQGDEEQSNTLATSPGEDEAEINDRVDDEEETDNTSLIRSYEHAEKKNHSHSTHGDGEESNLNMCSAYTVRLFCLNTVSLECFSIAFVSNSLSPFYAFSIAILEFFPSHLSLTRCLLLSYILAQHVFADTLRSLAVIFASLLAEFTSSVTSEEADAAAALVVSILIILSLIPLFAGMVQTFKALKGINELLDVERAKQTASEEDFPYEADEETEEEPDESDHPTHAIL